MLICFKAFFIIAWRRRIECGKFGSYHLEIFKVCIVDDEQELADTYSDYLKNSYEVRTFSSAQAALAEFEKDYDPDLVLTDLKMPGMDGDQFIDALHGKNIHKPVIIMSGHAGKAQALKAFDQQVSGFLEKPFEPKKLRATIEQSLAKSELQKVNERLLTELARLSDASMELVARYRHRFIRAENLLYEAGVNAYPKKVQVLELLEASKAERVLEDVIEKNSIHVRELMRVRKELTGAEGDS